MRLVEVVREGEHLVLREVPRTLWGRMLRMLDFDQLRHYVLGLDWWPR